MVTCVVTCTVTCGNMSLFPLCLSILFCFDHVIFKRHISLDNLRFKFTLSTLLHVLFDFSGNF